MKMILNIYKNEWLSIGTLKELENCVIDTSTYVIILNMDYGGNIMETVFKLKNIFQEQRKIGKKVILKKENTLSKAEINKEYIIRTIETNNDEIKDFLFTLGCYEGEEITVISVFADNYVISVKDARYSIDIDLAACIYLEGTFS